jgi:hypothetical protein
LKLQAFIAIGLSEAKVNEKPTPSAEQMAEWEARAEAAYAAMYDAPDRDQKDLKDDALLYLGHAIEIAEALALNADAARLKARESNIIGVWNSQFRPVRR